MIVPVQTSSPLQPLERGQKNESPDIYFGRLHVIYTVNITNT